MFDKAMSQLDVNQDGFVSPAEADKIMAAAYH